MTDRRSDPLLVHFHRAVVSHMDVGRLRMDATTNRAAVTLAGLSTFSFSTATAPHHVLLRSLSSSGSSSWNRAAIRHSISERNCFRTLNRTLIVPAFDGSP